MPLSRTYGPPLHPSVAPPWEGDNASLRDHMIAGGVLGDSAEICALSSGRTELLADTYTGPWQGLCTHPDRLGLVWTTMIPPLALGGR